MNITKKQFKTALEKRRIYIVGCKYTSNGWTGFNIYQLKNNSLIPVIVEKCPYYKTSKGYYHCSTWGTNRGLEIILEIGYTLGLKFEEIKQNYLWLN